jgi:pre-rRNA-processing protein TSR3
MFLFPTTLILRHRRENLKKCSLRGLEGRADMKFYTYPRDTLPDLKNTLLLTLDGPPLTYADADHPLFLIDGTWRHAGVMFRTLPKPHLFQTRSLPAKFLTAYPRRQEDCSDPSRGLASVEALYCAYHILGRDTSGLLDHYHWREEFLEINDWKKRAQ